MSQITPVPGCFPRQEATVMHRSGETHEHPGPQVGRDAWEGTVGKDLSEGRRSHVSVWDRVSLAEAWSESSLASE